MNATLVPYTYPPSYQGVNAAMNAKSKAFSRYLVLGIASFTMITFTWMLFGLTWKRPRWWFATLTRWFHISDPESTSQLMALAGSSRVRQRVPANSAMAISLEAWRIHQEEKHEPPPPIDQLEQPYYVAPATPPQEI
ncbi:unnamed protein product [Aphanomyces euteiches]